MDFSGILGTFLFDLRKLHTVLGSHLLLPHFKNFTGGIGSLSLLVVHFYCLVDGIVVVHYFSLDLFSLEFVINKKRLLVVCYSMDFVFIIANNFC